jgi:hypothetical protein
MRAGANYIRQCKIKWRRRGLDSNHRHPRCVGHRDLEPPPYPRPPGVVVASSTYSPFLPSTFELLPEPRCGRTPPKRDPPRCSSGVTTGQPQPNAGIAPMSSGFQLRKVLLQRAVNLVSIPSVMNSPMTGRADAGHPARVIWTAITQTSRVVRLQIWRAIGANEWGRLFAGFALAMCASEHVGPHRRTPLIIHAATLFGTAVCCGTLA